MERQRVSPPVNTGDKEAPVSDVSNKDRLLRDEGPNGDESSVDDCFIKTDEAEDRPRNAKLSPGKLSCRCRHGLLLAVTSAIFFSVQAVCLASVSTTLSPFQISVMLMPVSLVGTSSIMIYKRISPPRELRLYLWLLPSGVTLSCLICFYALSYQYLNLADTVTISHVSLIFVGLFSWVILKDSLSAIDFLFAITALAGVIFISRPSFIFGFDEDGTEKSLSVLGVAFALGAGITSAATAVFVRKQNTLGIQPFTSSLSNGLVVESINLIVCTASGKWKLPAKDEWLWLLGAGVAYFVAQISMYVALSAESATLVTIVGTLQIVLAFVWQFIIFSVVPDWTSLIGGVLVVIACFGVVLRRAKHGRSEQLHEVTDG